jgi:GntR family transcriptional regulator, carbon starvation induced regulator
VQWGKDSQDVATQIDNDKVAASNGETTLASAAYHRLLDDILWGRLEAGRKLRLQELKQKYNIGSSPLREALSRLAESGFVQREENRGFRVCPMTAAELDELITTRCWLEEVALRDSIRYGDKAWEGRVVLALHWLTRARRSAGGSLPTTPEWEDLHRNFHLALISACRSKTLIDFCDQLMYRTLRYRNLSGTVEYREQHERDEHRSICEAVLDRDADTAIERLQSHYRLAQTIVGASGVLEKAPVKTE